MRHPLEDHQIQGGWTLPPHLVGTNLKPDIVIMRKKAKTLAIFELTVHGETRITATQKLKLRKYKYFESDIQTYKVLFIYLG